MKNENHEKLKKQLKIAGFILLAVGFVCTVVGMANFFSSAMGGDGEMPKLFWLMFIGVPCLGVGGSLLGFAYRREIMNFNKNESVPVINDAAGEIAPAVRNIAEAVKTADEKPTVKCACGEENPAGSKFCRKCGRSLAGVCPDCGKEVGANDEFCNNCGAKLK